MKTFIQIAAFVLLFVINSPAQNVVREATRRKTYTNGRFGFILSYPKSLVAGKESMNGDGREFHSADGDFSLAASAHFFSPENGDTFEARWKEELATPRVTITYKKKAADWYVVSGITDSGTEYYHKLHAKGMNWAGFHITYPHAKNKKYDPWVAAIEKSFVPFLPGEYDRIE